MMIGTQKAAVDCDFAIIGAGIVGASLAAVLAPCARVWLIEAEDQPGYHATGRSAAFWSETYGGPLVQPLTTASGADFHAGGWLRPRGHVWVALPEEEARLEAFMARHRGSPVRMEAIDRARIDHLVPGLNPKLNRAVWEPECSDIDVAGFHADCLARFRRAAGRLLTDWRVAALAPSQKGWTLTSQNGDQVKASVVVNAAGAWADEVAQKAGVRPLGLTPMRRTIAQVTTSPANPRHLPLVIDVAERFYFKAQGAGRLWICPQDETPMPPHDVAPDELDVATAIARVEAVTRWSIQKVERSWAGLRTFAPDRLPVYGFAPDARGFYWCAGQGGFGIQTAPAAARMVAADLLGQGDGGPVAITPYRPERFA